MSNSSEHPAFQTHSPRPLASLRRQRARPPQFAQPRRGRRQAPSPRSPCHRSSSGSSGSGRRSPCQWCTAPRSPPPESAWPDPRRTPERRTTVADMPPPSRRPQVTAPGRPSLQPSLTVAGPRLAVYWPAVRPLRLSDWLRRTQHPGHLGKSVSLGNRVGVGVGVCFRRLGRKGRS